VRRLRKLALVATAAILIYLSLSAVIGIVAVESALHPQRRALTPADQAQARTLAAQHHADLRGTSIPAKDGVILRAWSLHPTGANGDTVLLLHGQADNRAGMLAYAALFLSSGYSVLLPDARAHGQSDGPIATYGVLEADDIHRWLLSIEKEDHPHCIYALGNSMGAAELLNSLPANPDLCAAVAESSFSSFRAAAYDRLGQQFHTGPWLGRTLLRPALPIAILYARLRYHIDLAQFSPELAAAHTRVPILLIHGQADTNLPPAHSERIKADNPSIELWEPLHATHCGALGSDPEEYQRRVLNWFAAHQSRALR
jgi:hypothetical protein